MTLQLKKTCSKCGKRVFKTHVCAPKPYENPMSQVAEMVANDIRAMKARINGVPERRIVAWLLPTPKPTVYCCTCVNATLAQQDRWNGLAVGEPWPVSCSLCGRSARCQ
jgi:hypothetical protein